MPADRKCSRLRLSGVQSSLKQEDERARRPTTRRDPQLAKWRECGDGIRAE